LVNKKERNLRREISMRYNPGDPAFDMPKTEMEKSHAQKRLNRLDSDIMDIHATMRGDRTTKRSQSMLLDLHNLQSERKYLIASLYRNQLENDIDWSADGTHVTNFKDGIPDL
jgi:hypothetical protein